MKKAAAFVFFILFVLQQALPAAGADIRARDISDFTIKIARDVAGFLREAGAKEVAVVPFKNADSGEDFALSEVLTGQILQELRYHEEGYRVLPPDESSGVFRVTGLWSVEGDVVKVVTRMVKMPSGEVDITYTGTIPMRRIPKVYIAADAVRSIDKERDQGLRIAVMDFMGYESIPKLRYLSKSIPETITTVFAKQSDLILVERLQRDKIMVELELAESKYADPDAAVELGKLLGANYMIIGSFQSSGKKVRLRARRVKVETGEIFEAASVIGSREDIFDIEDQLAKILLDDIQKYR